VPGGYEAATARRSQGKSARAKATQGWRAYLQARGKQRG
jgi:hypothetical protein